MTLVTDKNDPKLKEGQQNTEGQHSVYLVLSEEERAKGFVRPVRRTYVHVGQKIKRHSDGRLYGKLIQTDDSEYHDESGYYTKENGYGGYIKYPEQEGVIIGKYVTQKEVDAIVDRDTHFGGCGVATKMGRELAETYARNPKFYGATFCCECNNHLPVAEFEWEDGEVVGS